MRPYVPDLKREIAVFDTVFWESRDTDSLRSYLTVEPRLKGKSVLEIGTGSGLISLVCLQLGARRVVATDINPAAVANAKYNVRQCGWSDRFEVRLVSGERPEAFAVIESEERFDYILSNPPWEQGIPRETKDFALYDPGFRLLQSLLAGIPRHLTPDGRACLAYGCVTAIREVQRLAPAHGLTVELLDDRRLEDLPDVFLPGMLLELKVQ